MRHTLGTESWTPKVGFILDCGADLTNVWDTVQLALEIIEWLGFIDTTDRQEFMSRERHEGTCKWIFNPDVCKPYHEWWSATEGFLWMRGKGVLCFFSRYSPVSHCDAAASGKSVIL